MIWGIIDYIGFRVVFKMLFDVECFFIMGFFWSEIFSRILVVISRVMIIVLFYFFLDGDKNRRGLNISVCLVFNECSLSE